MRFDCFNWSSGCVFNIGALRLQLNRRNVLFLLCSTDLTHTAIAPCSLLEPRLALIDRRTLLIHLQKRF